MNEIDEEIEEQVPDSLSNTFYAVSSKEEITFYVAGILDISETEYEKGNDFLRGNKSFAILEDMFYDLLDYTEVYNGIPAFSFKVEENYVDRVYRDSYYFYFSGKHFCYDRFCKRIFLFANKFDNKPMSELDSKDLQSCFVGTVVIRPLLGRSVGRTLLNPKFFLLNQCCYLRMAEYNMTMYGKRLSIKAFPYSMQDGETTTCAEITILNLLDYYSRCYPEYHYLLPSDINRIAKENGYERSLPTHGLKYEMISKTFCESGFYPRLYTAEKMPKDKFRMIFHYYVESGIPLSLGVTIGVKNKHSVIVIGHGDVHDGIQQMKKKVYLCYDSRSGNSVWVCDAVDIIDKYCVMDDNKKPYMLMNCKIDNEKNRLKLDDYIIETMMVPLYKKMYLEADDASDVFRGIIASREYGLGLDDYSVIDESTLGKRDNPIAIRIFMTSSRSLRKCRDEQFKENNKEVEEWYATTVFPKFVWVCELSTVDQYSESVFGEIILDATSSADAMADSLIIAHYPKRIFCRLPQDVQQNDGNFDTNYFHEIKEWNLFKPYDSNLYPINE